MDEITMEEDEELAKNTEEMSEPKFNIVEKKPTTNTAALKKTKTTPGGTPHGTPGGKGRKRIKQEDVVGDEMLEMLKLEMGKVFFVKTCKIK